MADSRDLIEKLLEEVYFLKILFSLYPVSYGFELFTSV